MNAIIARILAVVFFFGVLLSGAYAQTGDNGPASPDAMPLAGAEGLRDRGIALFRQRRYQEAVPFFERALEMNERSDGPTHPQTAYTIFLLADTHRVLRRYAESEILFERTLPIYLKREHENTAVVLSGFAHLRTAQGRREDAEKLHRQALAMRKKVLGERDPAVAASLLDLAVLYSLDGRGAEAEPLYRQAIAFVNVNVIQEKAQSLADERRHLEAVPLLEHALSMREKSEGPSHRLTGLSAYRLAEAYRWLRRYADAERLYERALPIYQNAVGREHQSTADVLSALAQLHSAQGRHREAETLHRQALEILQKALGPQHPRVAISLLNLSIQYSFEGRGVEAEAHFQKAMTFTKVEAVQDHARVLTDQGRHREAVPLLERLLAKQDQVSNLLGDGRLSAFRLAEAYRQLRRYGDAEALYERALGLYRSAVGAEHPSTSDVLYSFALLRGAQGRRDEAETLHKQALDIRQKTLSPKHPNVAASLLDLAVLYSLQGRDAEAEPLYQLAMASSNAGALQAKAETLHGEGQFAEAAPLFGRALAIREKSDGPSHPRTGTSAQWLARALFELGRYAEADSLYDRALAIAIGATGREHGTVASILVDRARAQMFMGRHAEAEVGYKEALAIQERVSGPDSQPVATTLRGLGEVYRRQGRAAAALPLSERSLVIAERVVGPDTPGLARALFTLGTLNQSVGRFAEAERHLARALAIQDRTLLADNPEISMSSFWLGLTKSALGRDNEAETLLKRSEDLRRRALGPQHPNVGISLYHLARLYSRQGRFDEAEAKLREALAIQEAAVGTDTPDASSALLALSSLYRQQGRHSDALTFVRRASAIRGIRARAVGDELSAGINTEKKAARTYFVSHVQIVQDNLGADAARNAVLTAEAFEVAQFATNSSAAGAVDSMGARFAAGNSALAALIRERQDTVDGWQRADAQLVAAVSRPAEQRDTPAEAGLRTSLSESNARIKALDMQLAKEFPEYAELASARPLPLAEAQKLLKPDEALLSWVTGTERTFLWALRRDRSQMWQIELGEKALNDAVAALRRGLSPEGVRTLADLPRFPVEQAYGIYEKLIGPAEPLLAGVNHVFVVQEGALASLPLGVLLAEKPATTVAGFDDYRDFPWLAKRYALTTLPSVSSLRALRRFAREVHAKRPFIGIGDPELDGGFGGSRSIDVEVSELFTARGLADVKRLRGLPALPDTAEELRSLARLLGAGEGDVYLRGNATEAKVKQLDLSQARVIAFATHGLVAGDLSEVAEPALVLTPPLAASPLDDGLLTASEVAQLKLNADLVILSACNTAAGEGKPGADALSGLARAYFYAGARALLVSHWPVATDAAVRLTTGMLTEASSGDIGRAEALRRSMQSLMSDRSKPHYAHPIFWAPFVVVGEGGRTGG